MLLSDNTPIEEIVNTSDSQSDGDYSPPLKIRKKGNQPIVAAVSLV